MIVEQVVRFVSGRRARVVAMGEPMHGPEAFPALRNAILEALPDCAAVAIESDSLAGLAIDEFVRGGPGDLDEVVGGLSPAFRGIAANRALIAGLRESRGVRFAAIDVPVGFRGGESPRRSARLLHEAAGRPGTWARLDALIGDDDLWTRPIAVPAELRDLAAELVWRMQVALPEVDPGAARAGELAARTVGGLLAYHAAVSGGGLSAQERLVTGLGIRDRAMAENVFTLERTAGQVLLFAHNEHVRRGRARVDWDGLDLRWTSAGAHLAHSFGARYVVFATAVGTAPDHGVGEPPPGTLEGLLARDPTPRLVPTSEIDTTGLVRRPSQPGYLSLDPATLTDADAVLFLPTV
ncbi:erythromycin esterase family protein [Pseudonocardia sp. WMMC193]|uniref:erythromycin esterase family protein n=1 Tax=Pseudonocardia sp. WMMC193 TaxID=2911965 RepID=UPI001F32D71A|nr:erythromycin esterase family protein [Pseudonocardia sp. WMMC193]MCF7551335.1 erythromycin esterase family protein [Pseudonocardia sp. WMMC193]